MSLGLRIIVASSMWRVGPILKAGYIGRMGGIMPMGSVDAFLGTSFC